MADMGIPRPEGLAQLPSCRVSGIYFLWKFNEIVYVGQSIDITRRIGQHLENKCKNFDAISYLEFRPGQLNKQERLFIEGLCPRYNRCGIAKRAKKDQWWDGARKRSRIGRPMDPVEVLGLTEKQFEWLTKQPNGPKKTRIPRANARRWTHGAVYGWADKNPELLAQARAI